MKPVLTKVKSSDVALANWNDFITKAVLSVDVVELETPINGWFPWL